jgi:glycosyltransferase involved in cell wall biosynthesis
MKVLGLCSYPVEAACTRYRLMQFIEPLAQRNIALTVSPLFGKDEFAALYRRGRNLEKAVRLMNSGGKRLFDSVKAREFDLIFVQREAMIIGPPFFEWLYKTLGKCPLVLDLDDATYQSYVSPTYGRLGSALKFFGKTDTLIKWSEIVVCGNRFIAEYVEGKGKKTVVVPTVVDTDKFRPLEKQSEAVPIIGWVGTHSTFPFLETLFPVFTELARKYDFVLKIVGAGKDEIEIEGVRVENLQWSLEREIEDFRSLDVGLYPMQTTHLVSEEWLMGKSGFKAIQYLSVGVPFVVTPVGVTKEIGVENETHFTASGKEEWYEKLEKLLQSTELRKKMGARGREFALDNYTVSQQAHKLASTLREACERFKSSG